MPDKKIEIPEISSSSTKKEMLEAYNKLLEQLEEKRETELKPAEQLEERKVKETIGVADGFSTEAVVKKTAELKHELTAVLGKLAEKLESEVEQYKTVKNAVELKKKELQEIFEIQKAANSLAALIEAQRESRLTFEQEMTAKREKLELEIRITKDEWEKNKKMKEEENKERETGEMKQRKRDKEEFDYNFQKEKQMAKDAFAAEKAG